MSKPYRRKNSRFWWLAPWIDGRQVRQSSGETEYDKAERKLKILEGKLAANAPIHARTDRNSFAFLLETVKTDYKIKRRRSEKDLERRIDKHLVPAMGYLPTGKISSVLISEYILRRQEEKAANASINRELAIVKRAFRLGLRSGAVSFIPHIEMLPEDNIRTGFFSEAGFRSILANTNALMVDIATVAYLTGWRLESVILLEWRNVDLKRGLIGLSREQTKNRKATAFPIAPFPELEALLIRRLELTRETERRKSVLIPYVFHRDGHRVRSIRKAWEIARDKAGLPGRKFHDFRRTAVRNLERMGFSETSIMEMVGLKTRSMFTRYNITTEEDILNRGAEIAKRVKQGM